MNTLVAQFRGNCHHCYTPITRGDLITYSDDDEYVHADCEAEQSIRPERETCAECFIIKPCECDS